MDENAGWLKTVIAHEDEISVLKQMLNGNITEANDKKSIEKELLNKELSLQEEEMTKLNSALNQQQEKLQTASTKKYPHAAINSLWSQDLLRERIKEVEQKYIALKSSFLKFLAAAI
jgi:hypothetical protein